MPDAAPNPRDLLACALALHVELVVPEDLDRAAAAWRAAPATPLLSHFAPGLGQLADTLLDRHRVEPAAALSLLNDRPHLRPLVQYVLASLDSELPTRATGGNPTPPLVGSGSTPLPPPCRYRHVRFHAQGGLGEVYVARDLELGRHVALKEIKSRHADDPPAQARFAFEAQVTAALEHPGIVPVHGLGTYSDGRPFYAMRFVKGENLESAITAYHGARTADRAARALALRNLLRRFIDVCNAVAYAHSRGVIHRDIKPANVMLGKFGETLVVDWGIARLLPEGSEGVIPLGQETVGEFVSSLPEQVGPNLPEMATVKGQFVGTPAYSPPEQALGDLDRIGPRSDVYSLGATLYHLLTGQAPFAGKERAAILEKVTRGDYPPPGQVNPAPPVALAAVCCKAMSLRPEDRYDSATALAEEIERWLADEPVRAHVESAREKVLRGVRRHSALASSLLVTLAIGVLALAGGMWAVKQEEKNTARQRDEANNARAAAQDAEEKAEQARNETQKSEDVAEASLFTVIEMNSPLLGEESPSESNLLVLGELARSHLSALALRYPKNLRYLVRLARVWLYFGHLQISADVPDASVESLSRASAYLEQLREGDLGIGELATFREVSVKVYGLRAILRRSSGEHALAVEDWGRVVARETNQEKRLGYSTLRAEALARAGRHREAMAEANDLTLAAGLASSTLYRLGKVYALSASAASVDATLERDKRDARAEECCIAAMKLFDRAFCGIYLEGKRRKTLKGDPDLAALRKHRDFAKWLETVCDD